MLTMTSTERLAWELDQVSFGEGLFEALQFRVSGDPDDLWLQVYDPRLPAEVSAGRKWRVSRFAAHSEVIQTALAAVLAWAEHEVREAFLYKGWPIFGPHHSVDDLLGLAQQGSLDVRAPRT